MKKFFAFALSAVLSVSTLCACSRDGDVAMEDLEYGATLRQLVDTDIKICFDSRFFTDDEMRAVSNYYYAVQTKDKELFTSVLSEPYVKYIEKNSEKSVEEFIDEIYNKTASSIGDGFEYTYIEAVECGDRTDDLEIDEITTLMNSIYEENGNEGTFEETIVSAKYAVLDFMAEINSNGYSYTDQTVYIFTCTDGIYIFT